MNFWMALVCIIGIILVWSLIYNLFDMKHKERMTMLRIEEMKVTLEGVKITKDKKENKKGKKETSKEDDK